MNEMQIFKNKAFGEVRVAEVNGEPIFCASDVCKALGFTNGRKAVADHVDEGDVTKRDTPTTSGVQSMTYVNESGLYALIFGSKLPQAKQFKNWVTSEVLPSIRKHGVYMTEQVQERALQDPDFLIRLATNLKEEKEKRRLAESELALEKEINNTNAPKVNFANAIVGCRSSCLIGELAKVLTQNGFTIGQNRLFEWLRSHGYLGTKGERYNVPNQKYVEQGLFEIKKGVRSGNDGVVHTTLTCKCTGKGQMYFINKFLHNTDIEKVMN